MKMIKPIVNISKIIDGFDAVVVGYSGVLSDGVSIKSEALNALVNIKKAGKRIILLSNTAQRIISLAKHLHQNKIPLALFDEIMTAGEILHYQLKAGNGDYGAIGRKYCTIGSKEDLGIFSELDFQSTEDISKADFLYMAGVSSVDDTLDTYRPLLEYAAGMNIPFVCAGNDTSTYKDGKVCLASGAVAEQYAVLGGKIITIGKPDVKVMEYVLDGIEDLNKEKVLMIGDNLTTDIKGANLAGIRSVLVSKGVHVNFLGEGYIPDVAKTRELSTNFDTYPDYVISNLRW